MLEHERLHVSERLVVLDRGDVRARHHDLTHDRVAELEDRVDQLLLLALDAPLLVAGLGHRAEVGLGDEGTLLQAASR